MNRTPPPQKIFIAGNIASGKTRLARALAKKTRLPLYHVDSIQFNPDLSMKPFRESVQTLKEIQSQPQWIIDGYGPLDLIHSRLEAADLVIYLDPPYWRNFLALIQRQLMVALKPRPELPEGAREFTWNHASKLLKSFKSAHRQMRPEMLRLLARPQTQAKTLIVSNYLSPEDISKMNISLAK